MSRAAPFYLEFIAQSVGPVFGLGTCPLCRSQLAAGVPEDQIRRRDAPCSTPKRGSRRDRVGALLAQQQRADFLGAPRGQMVAFTGRDDRPFIRMCHWRAN